MLEFLDAYERKTLIEENIKMEWEMFQKVNNIDGRAGCQDEWGTFQIMRNSQYSAWPHELIKSYHYDLDSAVKSGRNLVMEKYAYMMEFSSPEYYKSKLELFLPKVGLPEMAAIQEITRYLVDCDKEFAGKYPNLGKAGRPVESGVNTGGAASVETYSIGELKTYSAKTLNIFLNFVRQCKAENKNIAFAEKETMVKLYGYSSLEDAESKMV